MVSVLVISSYGNFERARCIQWNQPFPNIEEFDSIIIDLTSFPKNNWTGTLVSNLKELGRATHTYMGSGREVFCIMNEPMTTEHGEKANYVWFPDSERLSVVRKKKGKSKVVKNERFAEYFKFVGEWDYEVRWMVRQYYSFNSICINRSKKTIAGTLSYSWGKGRIHLLPKTTKLSVSDSIELLIDLALGTEVAEYPWRAEIEVFRLQEIETKIELKKEKIASIEGEIEDLELQWKHRASYRDLFSKDDNKIPKAVQKVLADLSIETKETPKGYVVDLKGEDIAVEVTSIKGKVNAKTKKINQLSRFIEGERRGEKVILVANTFKQLPIAERMNKEHITNTMEKFIESVQVCFMTTLTLYQLWMCVQKKEMSVEEASSLVLSSTGVLQLE